MKRRVVSMVCLSVGLLSIMLQSGTAETACISMSSRGFCLLSATASGSEYAATPRDSSDREAETQVCRSGFDVVPCRSAAGSWDGGKSCYVRVANPQPKDFIPMAAGRDGGMIMECSYPGSASSAFQFWVATADVAAAPDPRVLAQTAISRMDLRAIRIGSFPQTVERSSASLGVVGWNVWLWVDGVSADTFGPLTKSATVGGYTVTATAEVVEVVWDMGNGDTVVCGAGTPYVASSVRDGASPDCGYRYAADGRYTITATTRWNIAWAGIGQSGVIPMELSATGRLAIAEIQVLNIPVEQK